MGIAEDARSRYVKSQRKRVEAWMNTWDTAVAVSKAARDAAETHANSNAHTPIERDLELVADWHDHGIVITFDGDDLEFFGRVPGDATVDERELEIELYVVMSCRRCGGKAPFGPVPAGDREALGRVMSTGLPAEGHRCLPAGP